MPTELSSRPFDHQIQQLPDGIHRKIDIHSSSIAKLRRPLFRLAQLACHPKLNRPHIHHARRFSVITAPFHEQRDGLCDLLWRIAIDRHWSYERIEQT
jgi:hypothetical protein